MPNYISAIKLPNGDVYQIKDNGALQLTGGQVTGPVNFGDSVYISDLNAGTLIVTGNAAFTNNIQANTINGVEVGPNPKFTDTGTVTSVAVAAASNSGITVSGSPITSVGTITIGLNLSNAINGLGEETSPANRNDYAVVQYAGGGTSTVTYHRRKLSNVFAALNSTDITNALGGNKSANVVFAGPSSGTAAAPNFRALVAADIPGLAWSKITTGNDDLKAIEALTGTSGLLKKTAANTWTLDTSTYLTGITSSQIINALGFTPYSNANPSGYTTNTGTVTSVQVKANSPLQSSTNTAQTSTLNTTISFTKQNVNTVLAGPSSGSSSATPSFRALVSADLPAGTNSVAGAVKLGASGGAATYDHAHGSLSSAGIISTSTAIASGDKFVIIDSSDSNKIKGSTLTFGNSESSFLTNKGTWGTPPNTTYSFTGGTNQFVVTPSSGTASTITITPSITDNITGSGTSGYLVKFNGANSITTAAQLSSSGTGFLKQDGTWATPANTTYAVFVKSGSTAAAGLVPKPPTTAGTAKFLRQDASWADLPSATANAAGIVKLGVSGGAATYEHTHSASLASDNTSSGVVSLSHGGQYKLTAGGSSVIFKLPSISLTAADIPNLNASKITDGILPVARGGTGETSFSAGYLLYTPTTGSIKSTKFMHLNYKAGTASTLGYEELALGNSTTEGTVDNAFGRIALYSAKTKGSYITAANDSSWHDHVLPDSAGWIVIGGSYNRTAGTATGVGSDTIPIYVSTAGRATAITKVGVAYGGTGVTSFTANSLIMSGTNTTAALTTRAISTSITTNASTNIPTESAVKTYVDNQIATIQDTVQGDYVTIAGNAQQVTGRKTLSNLAGASFKPAEGSELCNISYNQSLGALVFSFAN